MDFGSANWPALIAVVVAVTLSSCAASAFLGNLTVVMDDWILLYRLFAGAIIVLTGVIIPLSSLPAPLAAFSHVLPVTNALPAFRAAFTGSALDSLWPQVAAELAVAAGYVVLGLAGYNFAEYFAKRRGIAETAA
jgi:ABC-2 type transport system permease protein